MDFPSLHMIIDFYNEIESSIKNNTELNLKNVVNNLSLFCFSDKFIPFFLMENRQNILPFLNIIIIYEMKEKFLSLKIVFPLFEELKNQKFENYFIEKLKNIREKNPDPDKFFSSYYDNNINSKIELEELEKSEKGKKIIEEINKNYSEQISRLLLLWNLYILIFAFVFKDLIKENVKDSINENFLNDDAYNTYKGINQYFGNNSNKEELNYLIDYLNNLDSLNHTKDGHQIILFLLNLLKNEKEISLREKIDKNFFKKFKNLNNINDKLKWILFEKDLSTSKSFKKYKLTLLEGKKEKEKLCFDFFNDINEIKMNKEIKGLDAFISKSIFTGKKILIIKINLDYYKKNKTSLPQIQKEINLIKKDISLNTISNTYIQIENKIINLEDSYNLFIKELTDRKIIEQQKEKEEKIKIIEDPKIYVNEYEINEIKLEKEII